MKKNILKEIRKRQSPLVFRSKDVEKKKIDSVIEAARWAPSCFNNQPWNFVFVHKKDKTRKAVEKGLSAGNSWAKKCPYIVVVGADPDDDCDTNDIPYWAYDSGMSVMNLCIEAEHQGLSVHQMAGFDENKIKKAVKFPDTYRAVVVFGLGYKDNPKKIWDRLSQKIKDRIVKPRERKQRDERFFFGRFEK